MIIAINFYKDVKERRKEFVDEKALVLLINKEKELQLYRNSAIVL